MKLKNFCKKYSSAIAALAVVTVFYLFVVSGYDMYYELNDDTMMRNILSGSYNGNSSPMCYFMLYPLGIILSILYDTIPFIQWYDIFLIFCQFICLWLLLTRLLNKCRTFKGKVIISVLYIGVVITYIMNYVIMITFTVTSGLMAVTAIFLFVTEENSDNLFKKSIISIILLVVAFSIRYMVIPMMLPFICIGGMYQWSKEKEILSADNIKKYFGIFGLLAFCLAAVFAVDRVAYSSAEWRSFKSFCDDRAAVYDYAYVPLYEENKEFYENSRITYEQYLLLRSYDFGLDESTDADIMAKLADYSEKIGPDLKEKINIAIGAYRMQITDKFGTPYHTLVLVGYLILLMSIDKNNKFRVIIFAAVLFISRSIIWMYLLGQGRVVARVIHPLYWGEFILLIAIAVSEVCKNKKTKKTVISICISVLLVISFVPSLYMVNTKYNAIKSRAYQYEKVQEYCVENSDGFYMFPVYSVGVLPEKVFDGSDEPSNTELLGGWMINSPLYYEKLEKSGIDKIDDAILNKDNVYIVQHDDYVSYDTTYPFEWLTGYYASKGIEVEVTETDKIVDNIGVYKVEIIN